MRHHALETPLIVRGFPALAAVTLVLIALTTEVGLNIWILSGPPALAALAAYTLILAGLAAAPTRLGRWHAAGAALAVLVMGGRAGGFVSAIVDAAGTPEPRWNLIGATAERVLLLASLLIWHRSQAVVAAKRQVSRNLTAS